VHGLRFLGYRATDGRDAVMAPRPAGLDRSSGRGKTSCRRCAMRRRLTVAGCTRKSRAASARGCVPRAAHGPFALGPAAHHLPTHPTPSGLFALDMRKRLPMAQRVPIGLASLDRKDRFAAQPRVRAPPATRSPGGLEAPALLDHPPRPAVSFSWGWQSTGASRWPAVVCLISQRTFCCGGHVLCAWCACS
jgi:hypothetical protein